MIAGIYIDVNGKEVYLDEDGYDEGGHFREDLIYN